MTPEISISERSPEVCGESGHLCPDARSTPDQKHFLEACSLHPVSVLLGGSKPSGSLAFEPFKPVSV